MVELQRTNAEGKIETENHLLTNTVVTIVEGRNKQLMLKLYVQNCDEKQAICVTSKYFLTRYI